VPEISLEDAAALRWLERYLSESSPTRCNFAQVTRPLAEPERCPEK
jgi:hypothetical protein